MTTRVQEHRYLVTDTRPGATTRPPGELWLNFPDYKLGMIDATQTAVDLLAIRNYAATSTYALGDYVVHAGDLLRAKTALSPHAFTAGDWDSLPTKAQNDALYTTQAQNDARYYTKAQSDANYYSKLYIDTAFYTRTYIDANFYTRAQADGRYLQLTGGSLSGELSIGGAGARYTVTGSYNHAMAFGWDGAEILAWVDGTYVGGLATQGYVGAQLAGYLALSGGVITGNLQVNGVENVYGTLQNNNGRLITTAPNYAPTITLWQQNVGAMGFWYDGNLNFGGMDGGGGVASYLGRLMGNGNIEASNRVIGDQGVFANSGQDFGVYIQSGQYRILQFASSWQWAWDATNGNLYYYTPSGFRFLIDGGGNTHIWGSLQVDGNLGVNGSFSIGGSFTAWDIHANGTLSSSNNVTGWDFHAAHTLYASGDQMWMGDGGSGRVLQIASGWYWDWDSSNGTFHWDTPVGEFINFRITDNFHINARGPCAGVGPYVNVSDERSKATMRPALCGLADILLVEPIEFTRVSPSDPTRVETGFSAQQLRAVIPAAVREVGIKLPDGSGGLDTDTPSLGVALDPIVAALVNATKELAQRLAVLEAHP